MNDAVYASVSVLPEPQQRLSLLVFAIDNDRYALVSAHVREVIRAVAITALPKAPAIVEGVINLRGEIVAVCDVRQRFGLRPVALHPDQHFIIARAGMRTVALRVDRAGDLVEVAAQLVEPQLPLPGVEHVSGVARVADGLMVIHDIESFLSLDEGRAVDRALANVPITGVADASSR